MAEDGADVDDIGATAPRRPKKEVPCNSRLEELARPKRIVILSLWQTYAYLLKPERQEAIKQMLQEQYSMSPEDTEKYFEQLREKMKLAAQERKIRNKVKRRAMKKLRKIQRECAYKFIKKLLKRGFMYAQKGPLPLVSPRVRALSDAVLENLCELRGLSIPQRSDCDKLAQFLINIADWIAIALEQIYFLVQIRKNKEMDEIEEQERIRRLEEEALARELALKLAEKPPSLPAMSMSAEDGVE